MKKLQTIEEKAEYIRNYKILTVHYKLDEDEFVTDEIGEIEEQTISDAMSGVGFDIWCGKEILNEEAFEHIKKDSSGNDIQEELFYRIDMTGDDTEDNTSCYGTFAEVLSNVEDCELLSDFEEFYRVMDYSQFEVDTSNEIKESFGSTHRCNAEKEIYLLKSRISRQSETFILDAWAMFERIRNFLNDKNPTKFEFVEKNESILKEWKEVGQYILAFENETYMTSEEEEEFFSKYGYKNRVGYINERVLRNIHPILNYDNIFWRNSIHD